MKKLIISKYTYGVCNSPVVTLKYSDTEESLNYYPKDNCLDFEIIEKIGMAVNDGYTLKYTTSPTKEDVRPIYSFE